MLEIVKQEAHAIAVDAIQTDTVAGHDAVAMLNVCPSLVINVPSVGGICHHPSEYTSPEDLELGVEILSRALWRLVTTDVKEALSGASGFNGHSLGVDQ